MQRRVGNRPPLTQTADGRTYVRYLPHGVGAGDRRAEFLAAYFSYPGASNQVEVFAPSGATARALVLHGEIKQIH
jgi:hypothetical protein